MQSFKVIPVSSYFQALSHAASNVVGAVLGEVPEWGLPVAGFGPSCAPDDINIGVGLVGDFDGYVNMGFDALTAREIAARMLGDEVERLDELGVSALCELANVITGHTRGYLRDLGIRSDLKPPTVALGQTATDECLKPRAISVAMKLTVGTVTITLGLCRTQCGLERKSSCAASTGSASTTPASSGGSWPSRSTA